MNRRLMSTGDAQTTSGIATEHAHGKQCRDVATTGKVTTLDTIGTRFKPLIFDLIWIVRSANVAAIVLLDEGAKKKLF